MEGSKSGTNPLFWSQSPTSVAHLAQNKFEHILRDHHKKLLEWCVEGCDTFFGYQCSHVKAMPAKVTVTISPAHNTINRKSVLSNKTKEDDVEIECKYLLAADGANSYVRNLLGIAMSGQKDPLQTLLNVHFTCSGLRDLLSSNSSRTVSTSASTSTNDVDKQRPAMLYFTFNEVSCAIRLSLKKLPKLYD